MLPSEVRVGWIFRYSYLWHWQHLQGQEEGAKDRPCLVLALVMMTEEGTPVVRVLPITHTPPAGDTIGIEIPSRVRQVLGLDDAPSWVIVSEFNVDAWPNAGLTPIPGRPGIFSYGFMPPGLFARIKARFLKLATQSHGVQR